MRKLSVEMNPGIMTDSSIYLFAITLFHVLALYDHK